jgi:uncharacterized protein YaeQ
MALKATICKVEIQITDLDREYYQAHSLTIAQHPSETEERMLLRILAFALNASATLSFTRGISTDDEPDIWQKNLSDEIELWIDLGQPDDKRVRKACGRADQVIIYTYKNRSANIWWAQAQSKLARFNNLAVVHLHVTENAALEQMAARNMQLQCTIQDGTIWLSDETHNIEIETAVWK